MATSKKNDADTDETQPTDVEPGAELGAEQVQAKVDELQEKGYHGWTPDPTPNEHYTVAGVTAGKPTPETDPELKAEADQRGTMPDVGAKQ